MNNDIYLTFDALTLSGIDILSKVNVILATELTALSLRDIDNIKQSASDKAELLNKFSSNIQQRKQLLETNNFESSAQSIQDFFTSNENTTDSQQHQTHWQQLEETLQNVIEANSVNEQVLTRNQKNLDTILSILQGQQANNILYNAKGSKGDYAGQSRIGKA